jgi:hypothetical protein
MLKLKTLLISFSKVNIDKSEQMILCKKVKCPNVNVI